MKRMLAVIAVLSLWSLPLAAGEFLMNNSGETATALQVTFSEPVSITGFGDILMDVAPSGESTEFTFSGGQVEAWGAHWLNWEPESASIMSSEWLTDHSQSVIGSACLSPPPLSMPYGPMPQVPEAVGDVIYGFIDEVRSCKPTANHVTPVYVSIPPDTPDTVSLSISTEDGETIILTRVDETNLVGWISVGELPRELELQVVRDTESVGPLFTVALENAYQAITLGVVDLPPAQGCSLPAGFLKGAALTDIWGSYSYGAAGEWQSIHLRDYFEPTCQRLADMGCTDVYIADTLFLESILPTPRIVTSNEGGARTITDWEMVQLVRTAHDHGLRLHVQIFLDASAEFRNYLGLQDKSAEWITKLLLEYTEAAVDRARIAEQAGVDSLTANWLAAHTTFEGNELLWWGLWQDCFAAINDEFTGNLEYLFDSMGLLREATDQEILLSVFREIDSFLIGPDPHTATYDDSLASLYRDFSVWLEDVASFRSLAGKPVYLELGLQSTDGYFVDGWHDVAIGKVGRTMPDFFEQARAYEAIFQACVRTRSADGVIAFKYHWDDPFGPELGLDAVARMDLSASIRNKPAEAILKRWFGGIPGPSLMITADQAIAMNRPWCPASTFEMADSDESVPCALVVDDFQQGQSSFRNRRWQIDFDSSELHNPGADPESFCHISFETDSGGNSYLEAVYEHSLSNWMKIRYWGAPIDVSGFDGVQLRIWSDRAMALNLEIAAMDPDDGWQAGLVWGIASDAVPRVLRIPFAALRNSEGEDSGTLLPYLEHLFSINLFLTARTGIVRIDDICLYRGTE